MDQIGLNPERGMECGRGLSPLCRRKPFIYFQAPAVTFQEVLTRGVKGASVLSLKLDVSPGKDDFQCGESQIY